MRAIYEPKGAAKEYADLALNHYLFCGHGCDYCYARLMMRKSKEQWVNGYTEKKNVLSDLEKDCLHLAGDERNVLLCFMADPYQPREAEQCLTQKVLLVMQRHGVKPTVLTKGGILAQRDFDILSSIKGSEFAVTLTTDDNVESLEWEPHAAPPQDRIDNLQAAYAAGIRTWVSFEPVFNPRAVLRLIRQVSPFTDLIKVGKLNHDKRAAATDWVTFRTDVIELLESLGCDYLIKHDLGIA